MLTKGRLIQLLVMLIVLVVLFSWRTLQEKSDTETAQPAIKEQQSAPLKTLKEGLPTSMQEICLFQQPCLFKTMYGNFYLSVAEQKIQPEQWINLSLQSDLTNWQVKQAKIVGKSMYMGKIPVSFTSVSKELKTAKTMVGACTDKEMIWRFDIKVEVDGQPLNLYFDFKVTH